MPISRALVSLIPIATLISLYLMGKLFENVMIAGVGVLTVSVVMFEVYFGPREIVQQYFGDINGLRKTFATCVVVGLVALALSVVFNAMISFTLLALGMLNMGLYALIHTYWKRRKSESSHIGILSKTDIGAVG